MKPELVGARCRAGGLRSCAHAQREAAVIAALERGAVPMQARCRPAQAFILSGNRDVTKHLRMKAEQRMLLTIGGMDD